MRHVHENGYQDYFSRSKCPGFADVQLGGREGTAVYDGKWALSEEFRLIPSHLKLSKAKFGSAWYGTGDKD